MSLQSPSVGWLRCNRNDDRDEDESDNRHAADCIYTDSLVGRHLNRIVPRIIHPALQVRRWREFVEAEAAITEEAI